MGALMECTLHQCVILKGMQEWSNLCHTLTPLLAVSWSLGFEPKKGHTHTHTTQIREVSHVLSLSGRPLVRKRLAGELSCADHCQQPQTKTSLAGTRSGCFLAELPQQAGAEPKVGPGGTGSWNLAQEWWCRASDCQERRHTPSLFFSYLFIPFPSFPFVGKRQAIYSKEQGGLASQQFEGGVWPPKMLPGSIHLQLCEAGTGFAHAMWCGGKMGQKMIVPSQHTQDWYCNSRSIRQAKQG